MKIQWISITALLLSVSSLSSLQATTSATGYVTPTSIGVPLTSVNLLSMDNKQAQLYSGNTTITFNKSDTDFAAVPIANITIPAGRYNGISVCYKTERYVKLDGVTFDGSGLSNPIYTSPTATSGTDQNAIESSATAVSNPGTLTITGVGSGSENCSSTYFTTPECVPDKNGGGCNAGDTQISTSTAPTVFILMDLYDSVGIDGNIMSLDNHTPAYPYASIGKPGAAIHLHAASTSNIGNITLLFGTDKTLSYVGSYGVGGFNGFCSGVGATTVTAAPTGATVNQYGPTWVTKFDSTTGKVQFVSGNCADPSACTSNGISVLDNVLQAVGSTVNVSCVADDQASPPYLGYTYTKGAGSSGSSAFTIQRIVDPNNLFNICTAASGSCGTY